MLKGVDTLKTYITHEDQVKHSQYVAWKTVMARHEITQETQEANLIGLSLSAWSHRCERKLLNMSMSEFAKAVNKLNMTRQEINYIICGGGRL